MRVSDVVANLNTKIHFIHILTTNENVWKVQSAIFFRKLSKIPKISRNSNKLLEITSNYKNVFKNAMEKLKRNIIEWKQQGLNRNSGFCRESHKWLEPMGCQKNVGLFVPKSIYHFAMYSRWVTTSANPVIMGWKCLLLNNDFKKYSKHKKEHSSCVHQTLGNKDFNQVISI